jgi:WD40 repeat protein
MGCSANSCYSFLLFFPCSKPLIIYPSGKLVIVKNYQNPSECFIYRGHAHPVTAAKFSPNGFWVASADMSGKVRVWSWDNPEHLTKLEIPVFAGAVYDLDWDNESKKIVASGDGSGILVKCFAWDTGNSAGEMLGHNKRVLSVAYKPTRPFRIMSGSEDMRCLFFTGPPFKLDHSNSTHSNFVNCVRYNSSGSKVVSGGSDKKIQLYDGATGEPAGEIPNAHDGGVYSVSFAPDNVHFVTASADKTLKIWNADTLTAVHTIRISADPQIADAQVSVLWNKDDTILSVSLNGNINVFAPGTSTSSTGPSTVLFAHQVAITAMSYHAPSNTLFSGSYDGVVVSRPLADQFTARKLLGTDKKNISGASHNGKLVGIVAVDDDLISVGWDDRIRWASIGSNAYHTDQALNGQPISLVRSPVSNLVAVVTNAEISLFRGTNKIASKPVNALPFTPTVIALANDEELAVGGSDNKTHILNIVDLSFAEKANIETRSAVSALAYHPGGELLAIGDAGRQVEVYARQNGGSSWEAKVKGKWVFHTSKITALAWSPSGNLLASGSLDENIYLWNYTNPMNKLQVPFTHIGGVTGLDFVGGSDEKLVSVGNDQTVVTWKLPSAI